jgi:hypothetical protein
VQVDPPFSIADILSGVLKVSLTLHLGEQVAVQPYQLDTLVEASFLGYLPSLLAISKRQEYQGGYGILEGSGRFSNNNPDTTVTIGSAWLTASNPEDSSKTILVSVLPTIGVAFPPGARTFTVRFGCFQQEQVKPPS